MPPQGVGNAGQYGNMPQYGNGNDPRADDTPKELRAWRAADVEEFEKALAIAITHFGTVLYQQEENNKKLLGLDDWKNPDSNG